MLLKDITRVEMCIGRTGTIEVRNTSIEIEVIGYDLSDGDLILGLKDSDSEYGWGEGCLRETDYIAPQYFNQYNYFLYDGEHIPVVYDEDLAPAIPVGSKVLIRPETYILPEETPLYTEVVGYSSEDTLDIENLCHGICEGYVPIIGIPDNCCIEGWKYFDSVDTVDELIAEKYNSFLYVYSKSTYDIINTDERVISALENDEERQMVINLKRLGYGRHNSKKPELPTIVEKKEEKAEIVIHRRNNDDAVISVSTSELHKALLLLRDEYDSAREDTLMVLGENLIFKKEILSFSVYKK